MERTPRAELGGGGQAVTRGRRWSCPGGTAGWGSSRYTTTVCWSVKGGVPPRPRKPATYFPTACPVNAKTKHTCLLPAGGQRAKMSVLEGWQMPWHPASPPWAPTLPLSAAHPPTHGPWPGRAEHHPWPKLAQAAERSFLRTCTPPLSFRAPKWTLQHLKLPVFPVQPWPQDVI